jgi:hypothetical protein
VKLIIVPLKCGRVKIPGNDVNRPKHYSEQNQEQIEVRECLLSFGTESVVFQIAIQKLKDQDI